MKQKMSLLNRMLLPIAPRLACEREAWRRHAQRNFYAAADRSPRSAGMAQSNTTGEQANQGAREIIRARARDLERNSDVMNSLLLAFERNVIGSGIVLQAKIRSADGTEEETLNSRIERLWRRWCRPGGCEVSGRFGFREVLALCLRRRLVDGGILVVRSYFEGRYQLQLLEVDDLDTTVQGHEGRRVIGGIEVDDYRRALAYHIRVYDAWGFPVETRRIPADRVSYLSCLTRTSQIREISPAAPSVGRVDDLNELLDAAEEKERVQCHFSMAIKKTEGTLSGGLAGLGRGFGQAQREEDREPPAELLEQGMVVYLNPGEEVQPISQAGTSSTVDPLVRTAQRLAGSSVGLSYEVASRDMSQVTYSSARQGLLEDQKTYRGLQTWLIDHLCETVYEEWLDWMVLSGRLELPGYERDAERYQEHVWLCSGWDWIDPLKEANANRIALETGQTTMQALCAARGTDWKEVAEQRAQERAYLEQLGLLDNGGMKDGKTDGKPAGGGQLAHRSAQLECRAVEGQPAQFEISISSETPAARWYGREILSHDAGAVDLSLLNRGGALLFAHGRDVNYGLVPVGKIVRAWLDEEKRQCRAVIEMDEDDPDSARLKSKLEKGMLSGVSIGYRLLTPYQQLKAGDTSANGRFTGPAYVATRWQPHEISLEPVPADPTVGVGRTMEEACEMALKEKQEGTTPAEVLPKEGQRTQEPVPAVTPPVPDDAALTRAVQAERERTTRIDALCARFGVDDKTRSQYLSEGQTVDQVRAAILERLSAERPPVAGGIGRETGVTVDELDKVRAAAADGLLIRAGYAPEKPADGAGEFAGMSFSRIAVECLSRSGVEDANRMSAEQLFRRSMTPDSAFVSILSNVANRIVLGSRDTVPTTFQLWTSKASASDFKPTEFYEIGEAGELLEVPQNGELKEARLSDAAVATRRLLTFGRKITFTRQLFINDDIGLVSRTLTRFSLAAQRGINTAVYDLLKQNPVMYDGNRLFSAAHRNLGTGAAPSTATFAEARKKMRTQRDISDNAYLNLSPAYILSSAADETEMEKLLTSLADPGSSNSGVANVFRNRMRLIVDAELDVDSGAQPYYFAADPRMADTIEVCYLNGSETPIVESRMAFDELGVQYRVYIDRGVTLLGYRGLFKNPGKA